MLFLSNNNKNNQKIIDKTLTKHSKTKKQQPNIVPEAGSMEDRVYANLNAARGGIEVVSNKKS